MTHDIALSFDLAPPMPRDRSMRIGCIGSGFIMNDCHLEAYAQVGFAPYAIASRTRANADAAAKRHGIGVVYDDWRDLVADPQVQILDVAIPPDLQIDVIRAAARESSHIRGIQAQKPLAMTLEDAREGVAIAAEAGIALSVNSNMRYDQSIRALKALIDQGLLGDVVLATIEMRAVPHWQEFLRKYQRVEIINMGIHHIDAFRYLFGDPEKITAVTRRDPRTTFDHIDGITQYTFQYANGVMATSLDDVWTGPRGDCADDIYIKWRVEGTEGLAQGTIGWPKYPARTPSTLTYASKRAPHAWITPSWDAVWFPDAFAGPMAQLMRAIEDGTEPEISGRDNLRTLACVEACYRSIAEERTVRLGEFAV